MKLLLDTNILLDCMMDRQPFAADARTLHEKDGTHQKTAIKPAFVKK